MFDIEYKGANGVIVSTKKSKLVADPKLSVAGLKDLDTKGAIELATEPRFLVNNPDANLVIEGPGEYEVGDFSIRGLATNRHIDGSDSPSAATIYRIDVDGVRIALLGNIAPELGEEQLESIGVIDIVIIPVGGGGYTLDHTAAVRLVRQIDPSVVIPVHYAEKEINYEVPQDPVDLFIGELGLEVEEVDKFKLKSASGLPNAMTVVKVKRS